jgi:hypothetical protein
MSGPYHQGELDGGLCGAYALVNAVDYLCGPLSRRTTTQLFKRILAHIETKSSLANHCVDGIALRELAGILKHVVCKQYPIQRSKPFHLQPSVNKRLYLLTLSKFLQQPNTVVLLALNGRYNHWTLVHRITSDSLVMYDSGAIRFLCRRNCSMITDKIKKQYWLIPSHTYLLQRR